MQEIQKNVFKGVRNRDACSQRVRRRGMKGSCVFIPYKYNSNTVYLEPAERAA